MVAVLDFMYNGQTKVQQHELDAFLAAAEELKIKGLTSSPQDASSSSRSKASKKRSVSEDNDGLNLNSSAKKSSTIPSKKSKPGPSSEFLVKSEEMVEDPMVESNEESYQDYEGELEPGYDESYQDEGVSADAFPLPADSKGKAHFWTFSCNFVLTVLVNDRNSVRNLSRPFKKGC